MGAVDVLVIGGGPAGSALASACSSRGLDTALLDPAPDRPWKATYGMWSRELPGDLPADLVAARAAGRVTAVTEHDLGWEYAVLDVPGAGGPGFGCRDPDEYCWEAGGLGVDDSGCGVDIRVGDMPRRVSGRSREPRSADIVGAYGGRVAPAGRCEPVVDDRPARCDQVGVPAPGRVMRPVRTWSRVPREPAANEVSMSRA